MISTSEIKISVIVDLAKGEQAMKAVHAGVPLGLKLEQRTQRFAFISNAEGCRLA